VPPGNDDEGIVSSIRGWNVVDMTMNERVEVSLDNSVDPISIIGR
jgi:hypothetical protein